MTPSQRVSKAWGIRLRNARRREALTQTALAERVGMSQESVSRYERGAAPWTPESMLLFAVALDREVPDLFPWPPGIEDAEKYRIESARKPVAV